MKLFKKTKSFQAHFVELLVLILGVFLGVMASEWSTNRRLKNDQEKLLYGLRAELTSNMEYISIRKIELFDFGVRINNLVRDNSKDSSFFLVPFKEEPFAARIPDFPGLGKSTLENSMFEASVYSNLLPDLGMELITQLSVAYNMQDNLSATRRILEQNVESIDSETTYREVVSIMYKILDEFYNTHESLDIEYKKAIDLIDNSLK